MLTGRRSARGAVGLEGSYVWQLSHHCTGDDGTIICSILPAMAYNQNTGITFLSLHFCGSEWQADDNQSGFTCVFGASLIQGRTEVRHWEPNPTLKHLPQGKCLPFPTVQQLIPTEAQRSGSRQGPRSDSGQENALCSRKRIWLCGFNEKVVCNQVPRSINHCLPFSWPVQSRKRSCILALEGVRWILESFFLRSTKGWKPSEQESLM